MGSSLFRRLLLCGAVLVCAPAVARAQPAAEPTPLSDALVSELCSKLFRRLADDDWRVRETAGEQLRALGKAALRPIAGEFRRTRDPEVRSRISEIGRELYWRNYAGFLGISMQAARFDSDGGVLVSEVLEGTAAKKAGLLRDDVIVEFNGKDMRGIRMPEDLTVFSRAVQSRGAGVPTRIVIVRDGERKTLTASLGPLPEEKRRQGLESLDPIDLSLFEDWWKSQLDAAAPAAKSPAAGPKS